MVITAPRGFIFVHVGSTVHCAGTGPSPVQTACGLRAEHDDEQLVTALREPSLLCSKCRPYLLQQL